MSLTYTRHPAASRIPETVTPVTVSEVSECLSRCDWSACDSASTLFQMRYARTDGGILNDPGYHGFTLVVFQDRERIEFTGPDGLRIRLFADQGPFPYPWGMGAWLDDIYSPEPAFLPAVAELADAH